jgi:hypothetical protein
VRSITRRILTANSLRHRPILSTLVQRVLAAHDRISGMGNSNEPAGVSTRMVRFLWITVDKILPLKLNVYRTIGFNIDRKL